MKPDGTISSSWEREILAWAWLPAPLPLSWDLDKSVSRFRCHKMLVRHFEEALARIHSDKAAWRTVGDFGGCFNWRTVRGSRDTLSSHAWAISIDLDVCDNPQGKKPKVHPWVVGSFEMYGFLWGGTFKGARVDAMHMEFADLTQL